MSPFAASPKLELMMVMVIIPIFTNVAIFWISDNFLMHREGKTGKKTTPEPLPVNVKSDQADAGSNEE